jgi:multiple sugar transport system substrate-binding protein
MITTEATGTAPRRLRFLALGAAAVLALAACSSGPSSDKANGGSSAKPLSDAQLADALKKPAQLTFWTWVGGIEDEVKLFEDKYPNIKVKVVNAGQGSAEYTKLRTALKAGTGAPDVVQVEFQFIPTFTTTGDLLDLSRYGANSVKDKFVDWTWSQVSQDGKVYGVPQDTGPMGMLYRQDIFDKYGIEVPKTWDEFAAAARKLHAANPKVYLTNFAPNEGGVINGLAWQAGSKPFESTGPTSLKIHLDDAGFQKVVSVWEPLIKEGVVSTDPDFTDSWYQGLAKGKYASWLTAAWGPLFLQGTAKGTSGKWRAAPLPQFEAGQQVSGNWGGSTSAVTSKTKYPEAAAALAIFLNSDEQSTKLLATKQFLFPATKAMLEDPGFIDEKVPFYGGQQVNRIFADISSTVSKDFEWSPFQDYVYSSSNDTLGKAVTARQDLGPAVQNWQNSVVEYAKKQGFTVS